MRQCGDRLFVQMSVDMNVAVRVRPAQTDAVARTTEAECCIQRSGTCGERHEKRKKSSYARQANTMFAVESAGAHMRVAVFRSPRPAGEQSVPSARNVCPAFAFVPFKTAQSRIQARRCRHAAGVSVSVRERSSFVQMPRLSPVRVTPRRQAQDIPSNMLTEVEGGGVARQRASVMMRRRRRAMEQRVQAPRGAVRVLLSHVFVSCPAK